MIYDRPTKLLVDLESVVNNYKNIKKTINNKKIMAIVKADAYGHGVKEVVKALYKNGVKHFGVATLEEALEIREFLDDCLILVLGVINPKNILYAIENNISICCPSESWLVECDNRLKNTNKKLKIHLKIDSGMARIGVTTESEIKKINNILENNSNIILEGIFTHYSSSDEQLDDYDNYQKEQFEKLVKHIKIKPEYIHHENSAATIKYSNNNNSFNLARVGISLYGSYPSDELEKRTDIKLKQASTLISEVVHLKKVKKGTKIGYGRTYEAEQDIYIATVPIGYRDGILRNSQGYKVLVNGEFCEIVGRVCMDQLMIKCSKNVIIGDKVLFYGNYGKNVLPVEEYAKHLKTIPYEVYCLIGNRVRREYR